MRIDEPECAASTYDIRYHYDIPLYTGGGRRCRGENTEAVRSRTFPSVEEE